MFTLFRFLAIAFSYVVGISANQMDPSVEKVTLIWETSSSEILSSDILFRAVVRPSTAGVDENRLRTLWLEYQSGDLQSLEKFVRSLDTTLPQGEPVFAEGRLVASSSGYRLDMASGKFMQSVIQRGDNEIVAQPDRNQIHVFRPGQNTVHNVQLIDLRYIPIKTARFWRRCVFETLSDGIAKIAFPNQSCQFIVNPDSGFVYEARFSLSTEIGDSLKLVLQKPQKSIDHLAMPSASISCSFRKGNLITFELYEISDSKFNNEIPVDTFKESVSQGAIVLDHRTEIDSPKIKRLKNTTNDVLESLEAQDSVSSGSNSATIGSEIHSNYGLAIITGFTSFVLVCLWFIFRQR